MLPPDQAAQGCGSLQLLHGRAGIEAKGTRASQPHLDAIAAIQDKKDLAHALGETLRADVDALNNTNFHTANLFGLWVAPGFQRFRTLRRISAAGRIQLPDREYYLADSDRMKEVRAKYQAHVAAMLKLAGFTDPDARATRNHCTGARDCGKTSQPGRK